VGKLKKQTKGNELRSDLRAKSGGCGGRKSSQTSGSVVRRGVGVCDGRLFVLKRGDEKERLKSLNWGLGKKKKERRTGRWRFKDMWWKVTSQPALETASISRGRKKEKEITKCRPGVGGEKKGTGT